MPCQILIAATTHGKQDKGQPLAVQDEPATWGGKEVPPNYVILRISNASADQVVEFFERWVTDFQYSTQVILDIVQITVSVSQRVLDVFGTSKGLKTKMQTFLVNDWDASIVSFTAAESVFDVPGATDLPELKKAVKDAFEDELGPKFLFSEADVDTALGQGGTVELTKAQAQARVIDRTL